MTLNELLNGLETVEVTGDISCEITGIVYDSRRAAPGALFVALPGEKADGATYVEEAIQRGAAAVVSQTPCASGGHFPCIQVADARLALAKLAGSFYGHPSAHLCNIGITGTNGKTTVSFMLREIFKAAGRRPSLLGTVRYEIGDRVLPASRTTPEAPDLQLMFAQMERAGCDSAVMEVSSHALAQHRVEGISYDAAVFTNLTQDHLDSTTTARSKNTSTSKPASLIRCGFLPSSTATTRGENGCSTKESFWPDWFPTDSKREPMCADSIPSRTLKGRGCRFKVRGAKPKSV